MAETKKPGGSEIGRFTSEFTDQREKILEGRKFEFLPERKVIAGKDKITGEPVNYSEEEIASARARLEHASNFDKEEDMNAEIERIIAGLLDELDKSGLYAELFDHVNLVNHEKGTGLQLPKLDVKAFKEGGSFGNSLFAVRKALENESILHPFRKRKLKALEELLSKIVNGPEIENIKEIYKKLAEFRHRNDKPGKPEGRGLV